MKSIVQEMVELLKKVEDVEQAATMLVERAYDKGFDNGFEHGKESARQFDADLKKTETDQEKRDRIVKQAKADIEKLKNVTGGLTLRKGYMADGYIKDAHFIVNKDKNTVVCLMKKQVSGRVSDTKGIAKCMPDDCFNEHIGKSIALHRALGLDVPQEYLDVPNPTKVRVGNVVRTNNPDIYVNTPYKVVRVDSFKAYDERGFIPITDLDIIDDSESEPNV